MTIEIKDINGRVLYAAQNANDIKAALEAAARDRVANLAGADLTGADLAGAYLTGANLAGAYLTRADLTRADLAGAYLTGAYLAGADLAGADLAGAYLAGAYLTGANLADDFRNADHTPLCILRDQPGIIRAYKLVNANGEGPFNGGIKYEIGQEYSVPDANIDEREQCAEGINLATLNWCRTQQSDGYRILIAEFTAADMAAIPIGTDGKFRVSRCKIVGELKNVERVAEARGESK